MKTLRITVAAIPRGFEVVRRFGAARLITNHAGRWQLLGGSATDRLNAREWISLFCHEALLEPSASEACVSVLGRGEASKRFVPQS